MKQNEIEKSKQPQSLFSSRTEHVFEIVVVVYYKPDTGKRKLDYIVGPFPSDRAALVWVKDNKEFFGKKGTPEYELSIRPE